MNWRFKQVDRLVAYSTLTAVLSVWLLLVGLDSAQDVFGRAMESGIGSALLQVLCIMPRRGYEWFDSAALIGSLLGMGALAASGELTALRAAGMSKFRICVSVALSLGVLTLLVALMGNSLAPIGDQQAQTLALQAKSKDVAIGSRTIGVWARDGDTVINAKTGSAREVDGKREVQLVDVRVFEFAPKGQLLSIAIAQRALHRSGSWTLYDMRRTEFGEAEAKSTTEAEVHWKSGLDPRLLALSILQPDYLSIADLRRNIKVLKRNQQLTRPFELAYWKKLVWPLNVLVLAICALPAAFGMLRSGGLGKRIFVGIVLAIGWTFLQRAVVNVGAFYGINLVVATLAPSVLLATGAWLYFRRA